MPKNHKNTHFFQEGLLILFKKYPHYIIGLFILTAYGNTLFNGFVWDDEEQIINNTIIHSLKNFDLFLYGGTFNTGGTNNLSGWFFRPMININYALLYAIFKLNAWGFHLFSLVFHTINSYLLFKILKTFNGLTKKVNYLPILLTIIFAIHPGILEAVSYIAALGDLMVTSSMLFSVYIILKHRTSLSLKFPLLMASSILFGLLYKESALAILPILISLLIIFKNEIKNFKTWIAFSIFPFLTYFLLRIPVANKPLQSPHYSPISEANILERLITIPKLLVHYIGLYFYPHTLSISQHFVVKTINLNEFYAPLITVLLIISFIFYRIIKIGRNSNLQRNILLFGLVWCIFSFGLISNIIPLDMTVAERWFYFPIIGMIIISYSLLISFSENYNKTLISIFMVFILMFTSFSFHRNLTWKNGLTLYTTDIKKNPNSFDLNNNAGVELFRIGKTDEAKYYFEKSIELQPKWHFAYNNLGVIYMNRSDYKKAEEYFKKTLELSDYHLAHTNLCQLYTVHTKNYEVGEKSCEESIKKFPSNLSLWYHLSINKYKNRKYKEALDIAKFLFEVSPNTETRTLYDKVSKEESLN